MSDWSSDVCSSDLLARHEGGERRRIKLMLGELHPPRQRLDAIAGDDRDRRLREHRPLVDARRHDMDAAPAEFVTRLDRLAVRVQPLVDRKSTRLNSSH